MKHTAGLCPFNGGKCSKVIDEETIEHCPLHIEIRGKDATGEDHDTWRCAISWLPILQLEMAGTNRTVAASVQSLRNEQTKKQAQAIKAIQDIEIKHASIDYK